MRDALSILDKIVSFTNGTVTYQNTLEHLNVLDHDYYFKLLDLCNSRILPGQCCSTTRLTKKGSRAIWC